jgi:hypothetical protein
MTRSIRSLELIRDICSGDAIPTADQGAQVFFEISFILAESTEALNLRHFYGNVRNMAERPGKPSKTLQLQRIGFGLLAFFAPLLVFANSQDKPGSESSRKAFGERDIDNPFDDAYWGFELTRNFPHARTKEKLTGGGWQPMGFYRYRLSTGWLLGAHAGFKELRLQEASASGVEDGFSNLPVLSFGYESLRGVRIYHPLYLFGGGKLQYLLPATEMSFPVRRSDLYRPEFGVAAVGMIAVKPTGRWLMTLRADRWRGTATTRLQGSEYAAGILVSL